MNRRIITSQPPRGYTNPPVVNSQPVVANTRRYVLFTWSKCKQCVELKRNFGQQLQARRVVEYDLDTIRNQPDLMVLFNRTSPNRNVPAIAVINNRLLEAKAVGVNEIKSIL